MEMDICGCICTGQNIPGICHILLSRKQAHPAADTGDENRDQGVTEQEIADIKKAASWAAFLLNVYDYSALSSSFAFCSFFSISLPIRASIIPLPAPFSLPLTNISGTSLIPLVARASATRTMAYCSVPIASVFCLVTSASAKPIALILVLSAIPFTSVALASALAFTVLASASALAMVILTSASALALMVLASASPREAATFEAAIWVFISTWRVDFTTSGCMSAPALAVSNSLRSICAWRCIS